MGRRSRKSKRKLNSLFMMLLLTAVLTIVSTYAWFSANREVSITGITAKVAAAEGLQISLDASTWGSSVEVSRAILAALGQTTVEEGQTAHPLNNFQWPEELEPVSSDGTISGNDVQFSFGEVSADGSRLAGITAASARTAAGEDGKFSGAKFIAFDIYLKNSSSNDDGDKLQLGTGSSVAINTTEGGKANTGLENCVRAGVLLYDNQKTFTDSQDSIVSMVAGTTPLFAVWEPNYKQHIAEVVTNDGRIAAQNTAFDTRALMPASVGKNITPINTTATAASEYDAATNAITSGSEAEYMAIPKTITSDTGETTAVKDLKAVTAAQTQLMLKKNSIMKARVYIWLEGQDPDCNDTASTGRAFDVQINLRKPSKEEASTPATPTPDPDSGTNP